MGYDNRRVYGWAMALSMAVVAIAGVFLAVRANFDPFMGPSRLIFGFEAVISTEFADIFRTNCLKNGLLPVVVDEQSHGWLIANPGAELTIDVQSSTLTLPDGSSVIFPLEGFARYCLLNGVDELGYLLSQNAAISAYEQAHQ